MSAAIFFQQEAYSTSGPKLMGRNAAGEAFLRGYLRYSATDNFHAYVETEADGAAFVETVRKTGRAATVRLINRNGYGALAEAGTMYLPGPDIGSFAWQRRLKGESSWSICGITHTTASIAAMEGITGLLTAPVQPWDAVICTSLAVKANVERLLQAQADYLQQRMGIQKLVLPQLPVIPLGIHPADFAYDDEQRNAARQRLGVEPGDIVVLYVGRLSFHAKAHPLAMYQALEKAAKRMGEGGGRLVLVECGWHANEHIENAFGDAAGKACPHVRVITLDGRVAANRDTAWAGSDIFCSLSDNIQETFGITPLEAMAAGLPVVVSDWDGYKDTVRDGIDGFRIPTLMPAAGLAGDLAERHALALDTYDMYCGYASAMVAVDIDAAATAMTRLIESPELRRSMGAAGRQRVRDGYDWQQIIPQYEQLWTGLGELRRAHGQAATAATSNWPARMEPFFGFAGYPTHTLAPDTRLAPCDPDPARTLARIAELRQLMMVNYVDRILPGSDELALIMAAAGQGAELAGDLVKDIPAGRRGIALRSLAWLVKLGAMHLKEGNGKAGTEAVAGPGHAPTAQKKKPEPARKVHEGKRAKAGGSARNAELTELFGQGRFAEAGALAEALIRQNPDNILAWNVHGLAVQQGGENARAEEIFRQALRRAPGVAELHGNLGNVLNALGRHDEAVACCRKALELRADYPEAWSNLGIALHKRGEHEEARAAYLRALELRPSLAEAADGLGNLHADLGNFAAAEALYKQAIASRPTFTEAWSNLGNLYYDFGMHAKAETALRRALQLRPDFAEVYNNLGITMLATSRTEDAAACFRKAIEYRPDYADALCNLGLTLNDLGQAEEGLTRCLRARELAPDSGAAHVAVAAIHAGMGRFAEAEAALGDALAVAPGHAQAWALKPTLRKMTAEDADWQVQARQLLERHLSAKERYSLLYALGKFCDDTRDYANAFECYRSANALKRAHRETYDRAVFAAKVDQMIKAYPAAVTQRAHPGASRSLRPVFIVGMPRSGTSLTEQILASHPQVFGAGELYFWPHAFHRHMQAVLQADLSEPLLDELAAACLRNLDRLAPQALRVVDKMPGNFQLVGLINAVFPEARIIHTRRNPIDTCLSIHFQNFSIGHPYANDLEDLAHYYREYHRLTTHWRQVLPQDKYLELTYESLVDEKDYWSERLADFLELGKEVPLAEFHKTERRVGTASKWQVRQPIYKTSKERWRNYEAFVEPLLPLLELWGD